MKVGEGVYSIRWHGRRVARVGSVAGLVTAMVTRPEPADARRRDIVSFAYVHEGADWFASWARSSEPRTIDVYDERSSRRVRLEVTSIFDPSRDGVVYEAEVASANGFFDAAEGPRKPRS